MDRQIEVVLDVDGVLADFEGYFCQNFGYDHREYVGLQNRYPDKKQKIARFVQSKETYKYLDIIDLGLDIANWLFYKDFQLHIVSSRPVGTYEVTKHWLWSYHVPFTSLTVRPDKLQHIKALQPDFVVDDIISVAEGCYQTSIPAILVKQPWNETPFFPRVENIRQFIESFEHVMDSRPVRQWR